MIILHFDLQPQFKYVNYFIYTSHQFPYSWELWMFLHSSLLQFECVCNTHASEHNEFFRAIRLLLRSGQSWKTTAHASLATQSAGSSSAGKSRLKQQIPNVKSITERWRYFVDFLHDVESSYFPKRFIYLRGIAFSGPYRWNFRKVRDFVYFIDPLLCIVASRASFSRHGLLTSR